MLCPWKQGGRILCCDVDNSYNIISLLHGLLYGNTLSPGMLSLPQPLPDSPWELYVNGVQFKTADFLYCRAEMSAGNMLHLCARITHILTCYKPSAYHLRRVPYLLPDSTFMCTTSSLLSDYMAHVPSSVTISVLN